MIHLWRAVETTLKGIGEFSNVMGYTSQLSLFRCIKSRRKGGTQRCGPYQMVENLLFSSVYREMCQIFMCFHDETTSCVKYKLNNFSALIYHFISKITRRRFTIQKKSTKQTGTIVIWDLEKQKKRKKYL